MRRFVLGGGRGNLELQIEEKDCGKCSNPSGRV